MSASGGAHHELGQHCEETEEWLIVICLHSELSWGCTVFVLGAVSQGKLRTEPEASLSAQIRFQDRQTSCCTLN